MPQNHQRINQTSSWMLQSWQANCNMQLLVYLSDAKNPDLGKIARITDYVVGYSCKGNETMPQLIKDNTDIIMRYVKMKKHSTNFMQDNSFAAFLVLGPTSIMVIKKI